jgi:hypothetical protein
MVPSVWTQHRQRLKTNFLKGWIFTAGKRQEIYGRLRDDSRKRKFR